MFLITADVVSRNLLGTPIQGVVEMVKLSVVGMTWAMLAYTLRTGGHLRSSLFLQIMARPVKIAILVANSLLGAALMAVTCWLGWFEMTGAFAVGAYEGADPVKIVIWPAWACLSIGAALTGIQFVLDAVRIARFGPSAIDDAGDLRGEEA
jgi:TRAP-type C4-dicarboxylate transport system permease small subunit